MLWAKQTLLDIGFIELHSSIADYGRLTKHQQNVERQAWHMGISGNRGTLIPPKTHNPSYRNPQKSLIFLSSRNPRRAPHLFSETATCTPRNHTLRQLYTALPGASVGPSSRPRRVIGLYCFYY